MGRKGWDSGFGLRITDLKGIGNSFHLSGSEFESRILIVRLGLRVLVLVLRLEVFESRVCSLG